MREITTRVYQFNELSEKVQDKIIEKWDNADYDWWQYVYEDAERVGVKITEFNTFRGTISLNCDYPYGTAKKILEEHGMECDTYKLAKVFLDKIQPHLDKLARVENIDYHRGYRKCLRVCQEEIEEKIEDLNYGLIHDLGKQYLSILRREYEYLTSRECIIETIEANGYEFTLEGKMV
jgi:hypothetical protein